MNEYFEIYNSVKGIGIKLNHSKGLVVNPTSKIGDYYSILQQVTIGNPNIIIGNYMETLAGSKIICYNRRKRNFIVNDGTGISCGAIVNEDAKLHTIVAYIQYKTVGYRVPHDNWFNYLGLHII